MRILIVTQWFEPEPAFKGLSFARKLAERGHQVEVLTGFPNYPAGRLYHGYRLRIWQRESVEGIPVIRVPLYPSHDRSPVRRAINYLSFAVAATILGPVLVRKPDVIYVYHPPATVALPGLALGRWFSAPVVCDVNDLWPDTIFATGMLHEGSRRLLERLCRFAYRHADRVTVVTPGFRQTLIARGVDADIVSVIYNWAPGEEAWQSEQPAPSAGGAFRIVFAGNMGLAQGLETVLEAAARCAFTVPHARFVFMGDGVDTDRLCRRAAQMRLANVEFLPRQSSAAANAILGAADALLVHLKDDPLFAITIPSKTQSYLAAGRPILMAVRGNAAELIRAAGAGVIAEPGNPESIAEAVRQLATIPEEERARMGQCGREFYRRELAFVRGVKKFETVLADACAVPRAHLDAKRLFDLAAATASLIVLGPLMALVALAVRLDMGSPVLFRQVRPGWRERPFRILKFRTMRDAYSRDGGLLPDSQRLTRLGQFLRATSLDELPQIWNVLKGEMSIVGPRPLLPEYVPRYNDFQRRRHEVKPGVTGWAQVNGRNAVTWERKFALDVWYVDHVSLWIDLKILWLTLFKVIRREDVSRDGYATTPRFMGNECAEKGART